MRLVIECASAGWPEATTAFRTASAAARSASTAAAAPYCASSARMADRCRSCSIDGMARASAEYREVGTGAAHRYRARFLSSDAAQLKALFELVGRSDLTEVLVDDRPVPYARTLWLPLVWFLLHR